MRSFPPIKIDGIDLFSMSHNVCTINRHITGWENRTCYFYRLYYHSNKFKFDGVLKLHARFIPAALCLPPRYINILI